DSVFEVFVAELVLVGCSSSPLQNMILECIEYHQLFSFAYLSVFARGRNRGALLNTSFQIARLPSAERMPRGIESPCYLQSPSLAYLCAIPSSARRRDRK